VLEGLAGVLLIKVSECFNQNRDIGHREIHSHSPGGWNDVGGDSPEKFPYCFTYLAKRKPAGAKQAAEKLGTGQERRTSDSKARRILNHLRHD
jgi:hypothetical protein